MANPLCRVAPAAQIPWGSGIMQIKRLWLTRTGFFGKHRCPPPGLDREFRLFRFGGGIGSLLRTNLPPANHVKSTTTKHCLRDTEDHMTVSVITSMRNLLLGDPLANSQKRNWTPMRRGPPPIALGQNPAVRKVFVVHRVSSRLSSRLSSQSWCCEAPALSKDRHPENPSRTGTPTGAESRSCLRLHACWPGCYAQDLSWLGSSANSFVPQGAKTCSSWQFGPKNPGKRRKRLLRNVMEVGLRKL